MKYSAGILLFTTIQGYTKYLFCHPSNASWVGTYSIPKGEYLPDKELLWAAAIRETKEETGMIILPEDIDMYAAIRIPYASKRTGKLYKEVLVYKAPFVLRQEVALQPNFIVRQSYLQLEEVDWAGFLAPWELVDKIFWRFRKLVMNIDRLFDRILGEPILITLTPDGKEGAYIAIAEYLNQHCRAETAEAAYKGLQKNVQRFYSELQKEDDSQLSIEFLQRKRYLSRLIERSYSEIS